MREGGRAPCGRWAAAPWACLPPTPSGPAIHSSIQTPCLVSLRHSPVLLGSKRAQQLACPLTTHCGWLGVAASIMNPSLVYPLTHYLPTAINLPTCVVVVFQSTRCAAAHANSTEATATHRGPDRQSA